MSTPSPRRTITASERATAQSTTGSSQSRRSTTQRTFSGTTRSEEHTSELQSRQYLVCRLLLEKKTLYNHRRSAAEVPGDGEERWLLPRERRTIQKMPCWNRRPV